MKVLILAQPNDGHTLPIRWALQQAGYQAVCWGGLSWTEEQQASVFLDGESRVVLGPHAVEPGDTVWIRRPDPPTPNPKVSEADRKFAQGEYGAFYHCVAYMLEMLPARCINKYSAYRLVANKAVQLHLARASGLKIPKAIMSNSPRAVISFFDHNPSRIIWKGFTPHVWERPDIGATAATETFELNRNQLPADEILTYAPGIYQDMVDKQFDVRTVLMGNRAYSFSLHSPDKALDWRHEAGQGKIHVEAIATPPDVERGIMAFAQRTGICFGSIDFAVDMDGAWWFLEINEQGQFLWLDHFDRTAAILQKFCAFLTAPEGSIQPLEERASLFPSFAEYKKFVEREGEPKIAAAGPDSPYVSRES